MTKIDVFVKKVFGSYAITATLRSPDRITINKNTKLLPFAYLNASAGNIIIGSNCYIDRNVIISCNGGDIIIGDHCSFNPFCVVYGHGGLTIGNDVRIATGTVIVPGNHRFKFRSDKICDQGICAKGISIGDDCWIGAGVTVLDGVSIGNGCVVGAGSIVTKSFKEYNIIAGNPAKVIGTR